MLLTDGWPDCSLSNWNNIGFKAICGEAAEEQFSFPEKLPSLIKKYSPTDIFNAN